MGLAKGLLVAGHFCGMTPKRVITNNFRKKDRYKRFLAGHVFS
jgi:hypothetical protein